MPTCCYKFNPVPIIPTATLLNNPQLIQMPRELTHLFGKDEEWRHQNDYRLFIYIYVWWRHSSNDEDIKQITWALRHFWIGSAPKYGSRQRLQNLLPTLPQTRTLDNDFTSLQITQINKVYALKFQKKINTFAYFSAATWTSFGTNWCLPSVAV